VVGLQTMSASRTRVELEQYECQIPSVQTSENAPGEEASGS